MDINSRVDIKNLEELSKIMDECNINEIDINLKGKRIRLKKDNRKKYEEDKKNESNLNRFEDKEKKNENELFINAPISGIFYSSPAPNQKPYVSEGDKVIKRDTLCIIESMKVMNEIKAEFDCIIKKILIENKSYIKKGDPLFIVEKC